MSKLVEWCPRCDTIWALVDDWEPTEEEKLVLRFRELRRDIGKLTDEMGELTDELTQTVEALAALKALDTAS